MQTFLEILNPSFLLFPALLGSSVLGLVCPLVGAYLILRKTVFLGLTLPQIAGAGVAFAFWLHQIGLLSNLGGRERTVGMAGSLLFTFLGMGLLGYLEHQGKGSGEGRLAAAYALAGALTILFIVFNPAGEVEILSLLKGEVIALSRTEINILLGVFGLVFAGMLLFRREFLLASFDRDLAFLLKGGNLFWDVTLYLLAGLSIAIGVIMAGPLLIFGFLVLPPLAARPLVRGMTSFLSLSSLLGVLMAFFGFYLSVRLDLPLGPTDVTLGCGLVFLAYGLGRIRAKTSAALFILACAALITSCGPRMAAAPVPEAKTLSNETLWLAKVKNNTGSSLLLPATNPLRSLAEMAGKISSDYRQSVMDLLRDDLRRELEERGFRIALPEQTDARFPAFPADASNALRLAREGKLSGLLFVSEISRWETDSRQFVRVFVDFKLIKTGDAAVVWERRIHRAVPTPSATNLGQAYTDSVREVVRDLFSS
ncbi:MAG TPA: metal ABC transporter permease [Candidatus Binatia bacterium]|nr:metal ABC transporter permease [Candidatus Binatia bacterium]